MFDRMKYYIAASKKRDPAARSSFEIFFLYAGFRAVRWHRFSHWCYAHNHLFLARWISEHARRKTGITICSTGFMCLSNRVRICLLIV